MSVYISNYIKVFLVVFLILTNYFIDDYTYVRLLLNIIIGLYIIFTAFYNSRPISNTISKNKINLSFKNKNANNYFVVLIEMTNMNIYSQFYDLEIPDLILKKIFGCLKKNIGDSKVFKYSENQIAVVIRFNELEILNDKIRYNEQLLWANKLKIMIKKYPILSNTSTDNIKVEMSMGVAANTFLYNMNNMDELVRLAHFTLIEAKKRKVELLIADESIKAIKKDLDEFTHALEAGFKRDEFNPFYQPILEPTNLKVVGLEALVRWQKDSYRIIEASKFKDIATEKELFGKIDTIIIKKTLIMYQYLRTRGIVSDDFFIVVNLSKDTLLNTDFNVFKELLFTYEVESEQVEFDIQIDDKITDIHMHKIRRLKELGFKISLDNLSLNNLNIDLIVKLNIDSIKFNVNFLNNLQHSDKEDSILEMLFNFTKKYKIKTYLKGIENKQDLLYTKKSDVDYLQGYYFTKPLDKENIMNFIKKYEHGIAI
ncbi:hypothetical protein CI105_03755 [Candidatus Izimaplasma bacterium ZiA1]|uniref:EAL domain-containing protein n=1 Tax=Candidatus Izimoplasma sp. ZiA1 TaxID=2024899 RepID=UPI000BAA5F21|nr:hypothetical protein CI105_03755 [Candidatus Izimaplasma bacterium ZiA1]